MAGEGTQQRKRRGGGRGRGGAPYKRPNTAQSQQNGVGAVHQESPLLPPAGSAVERPGLWQRYMPGEGYDELVHGTLLRRLTQYVAARWQSGMLRVRSSTTPYNGAKSYANEEPEGMDVYDDKIVAVDYDDIARWWTDERRADDDDDVDAMNTAPAFEETLVERPAMLLALIALAVHQVMLRGNDGSLETSITVFDKVVARVEGFQRYTSIKELRASLIGTWLSVRGTVVRISSVKPLVTQMEFTCGTCSQGRIVVFEDGKFAPPTKCTTTGCKSRQFTAEKESSDTITIDYQTIKIQEKLLDEFSDAGRVPRTLTCEVAADLVDMVIPGDVISVSGIVKYVQLHDQKGKNKGNNMHVLYVDANAITKSTGSSSSSSAPSSGSPAASTSNYTAYADANSKDSIEFDVRDYYAIKEIAAEPSLFKLLVHSLCPSIFGHEVVKAGLLLALFGGRQRYNDANASEGVSIRGDSHVLVVGDPGLGKSQMLSAVVNAAPRGVYVCSNTATSSGLTVTLSREAGSGEFAIEAGALVLADQGCCCIDEFDKMTEYEALLEAMEQQSISIAKAGVMCNLPARTTVIAAANPVGGHYNKARTVSENLKMEAALLSRFDLIFILLDRPDEAMDRFLSEHVMKLHSSRGRHGDDAAGSRRMTAAAAAASSSSGRSTTPSGNDDPLLLHSSPCQTSEESLLDRLKKQPGEEMDLLPLSLLRKYIAYSRQYVHPRLSTDAAAVLQDFYLELRSKHRSADTTPITTRQLESMIRLTEARARSELRQVVAKEDAEDVVTIMKLSLFDTYSDPVGDVHFSRSQMGTGMSLKSELKRFASRLHSMYTRSANYLFTFPQLMEIAREMNVRYDFRDFLDMLGDQGYLLKRGNGTFKLCIQ